MPRSSSSENPAPVSISALQLRDADKLAAEAAEASKMRGTCLSCLVIEACCGLYALTAQTGDAKTDEAGSDDRYLVGDVNFRNKTFDRWMHVCVVLFEQTFMVVRRTG